MCSCSRKTKSGFPPHRLLFIYTVVGFHFQSLCPLTPSSVCLDTPVCVGDVHKTNQFWDGEVAGYGKMTMK